MSRQGWLYFWEIVAATGTVAVIIGLLIEYGLETFTFLKFWERSTGIGTYSVKVESPRERKGALLVVLGIVIELLGGVGTIVQSFRVETENQRDIAILNQR